MLGHRRFDARNQMATDRSGDGRRTGVRLTHACVAALTATLALAGLALPVDAAVVFQPTPGLGMTNSPDGDARTLNIAKPAGLAVGDLMLAQVTHQREDRHDRSAGGLVVGDPD